MIYIAANPLPDSVKVYYIPYLDAVMSLIAYGPPGLSGLLYTTCYIMYGMYIERINVNASRIIDDELVCCVDMQMVRNNFYKKK